MNGIIQTRTFGSILSSVSNLNRRFWVLDPAKKLFGLWIKGLANSDATMSDFDLDLARLREAAKRGYFVEPNGNHVPIPPATRAIILSESAGI